MLVSTLAQSARAERLHPLFKKLFDYVKTHDLTKVPAGRIVLQGEELFINVDDATLRSREEQKLEVHRRYIDVHFPLSGVETVGWCSLETLTEASDALFDAEKDFALYTVPASSYFEVQPGSFYIVWPEDAHAPIIGEGRLRKAIAKVQVIV